jgi:hypothetical protein
VYFGIRFITVYSFIKYTVVMSLRVFREDGFGGVYEKDIDEAIN